MRMEEGGRKEGKKGRGRKKKRRNGREARLGEGEEFIMEICVKGERERRRYGRRKGGKEENIEIAQETNGKKSFIPAWTRAWFIG